jgi:hypothetical protein
MTGTATDRQGDRIPQRRVRATEIATGYTRETLTTSQGSYELSALPSGVYTVQFTKGGFAPFMAAGVSQRVGETTTINARLEVARGHEEQITVAEPLIGLNQVDATVGTLIEHTQVTVFRSTAATGPR